MGNDNLYYPDLKLPKGTDYPIGKFGHMRCEYLKEFKHGYYMELLLDGKARCDRETKVVESDVMGGEDAFSFCEGALNYKTKFFVKKSCIKNIWWYNNDKGRRKVTWRNEP